MVGLLSALFLLVVLAIFLPIIFKWLALTGRLTGSWVCPKEGTIRAVIALVLIILFGAVPIYLFNNVSGLDRMVPNPWTPQPWRSSEWTTKIFTLPSWR